MSGALSETPRCDALGFAFVVTAENPRLTQYLGDLFAGLESPGRGTHRYAFHMSPDRPVASRCELTLDGRLLFDAAMAERLVSNLVRHVNRQAIEGCDAIVLHAGGIEHEEVGFILPAEMEAGKTTLTAGLVRAGLGYLTDEAVAVEPATLLIQPYPKPFSLDPGSWALFPELEPLPDLSSDEYKAHEWLVAPRAVGNIGRSCPVGVVAFPQYSPGAETELIPMARAEALIELTKNTFRFDARPREALDVLAEVVRSAECYRFTIGDLDSAVSIVMQLIGARAGTGRPQ